MNEKKAYTFVCNVINTVACALQIPTNLIFLTKDDIYQKLTHFTAEKTEAMRNNITCSR